MFCGRPAASSEEEDNRHSATNTCTHSPLQRTTLKLIDYEYAGFNPRVMDIANTFCEHADMNNLRANFDTEYPSPAAQDEFLRAYLEQSSLSSSCVGDTSTTTEETVSVSSSSSLPNVWKTLSTDDQAIVLTTLRQLIGEYTLVSHVQRAIWSMVKHYASSQSSSSFDYLAYAHHRLHGYHWSKQQFWA